MFRRLLRELELTFTLQGESLVITTQDHAENELLNRIYWLEGTGFATGDYDSIIESLQNIEPDTWEIVGGNSTVVPVMSKRPALLVATTYDVHKTIEKLFQTLRESHFGDDPVLESVQVPARNSSRKGGLDGAGNDGLGGGGIF